MQIKNIKFLAKKSVNALYFDKMLNISPLFYLGEYRAASADGAFFAVSMNRSGGVYSAMSDEPLEVRRM